MILGNPYFETADSCPTCGKKLRYYVALDAITCRNKRHKLDDKAWISIIKNRKPQAAAA